MKTTEEMEKRQNPEYLDEPWTDEPMINRLLESLFHYGPFYIGRSV